MLPATHLKHTPMYHDLQKSLFCGKMLAINMVTVAEWSKASGCGPEDRGFKSHQSPTQPLDRGAVLIMATL